MTDAEINRAVAERMGYKRWTPQPMCKDHEDAMLAEEAERNDVLLGKWYEVSRDTTKVRIGEKGGDWSVFDPLHDWQAFGRLWEWIEGKEFGARISVIVAHRAHSVIVDRGNGKPVGDQTALGPRRALALAFLEATEPK